MRLGRRAWGCDLNPEVIPYRPTLKEFNEKCPITTPILDDEYPYQAYSEFITDEQLQKLTKRLIDRASRDQLISALGPKTGSKLYDGLHPQARLQTELRWSIEEESE